MANSGIHRLCCNTTNVSSELAKNPSVSPSILCKQLFEPVSERKHSDQVRADRPSEEDVKMALRCGRWGPTQPSLLFLEIYSNVLKTLTDDPLNGVCSPSLLGSNGVCPLAVIATIPEICRHMSNIIVRAEKEVFLATNYWVTSEGSKLLANSLRELSKRSVEAGRRVVVKVLYDKGSIKQFLKNHVTVSPKTYADEDGDIALPHPDELPNVDLEVVNYHRPMLGTFHAKFMIVDRRIAVLQSNNIMDNANLEMMAQYEGDIVDSFYDMAMISWHRELEPKLPCLDSPASQAPTPTSATSSFRSLFPGSNASSTSPPSVETLPVGRLTLQQIASHTSDIELPRHTSNDPHYDIDVAAEIKRAMASLNPKPGERRVDSITKLLNEPAVNHAETGAPEIEPQDMFSSIIPIAPHSPFPIAMVNRAPHGTPDSRSLHTPQNAAFISALRYARTDVFIQTPDLNAHDLLPEILAACRRGIKVTYYYCLGYNDAGELLPQQGGHNEMIAHILYTSLADTHRDNLTVHAYVAKDQTKPIHNTFKKRSCHIKLMIVDGHIGIQGSGNQDTQSWYHSQEANVMIDSALVCGKWMQGIRQNQNTHLYGRVASTGEFAGCWVDPDTGRIPEGSIGTKAGHFAWSKGAVGALQRVRGKGGF